MTILVNSTNLSEFTGKICFVGICSSMGYDAFDFAVISCEIYTSLLCEIKGVGRGKAGGGNSLVTVFVFV